TIFAIDADGTDRVDIVDESTVGLLLGQPSWLTDGSGILFIGSPGEGLGSDVYRVLLDGTGLKQLTTTTAEDASPRMSPDGQSIAFIRHYDCLCTMAADGSNEVRLEGWSGKGVPLSWSPDGTWIAKAGGAHGPLFTHVTNATSGDNVM